MTKAKLYMLVAVMLVTGTWKAYGQNMTEIHYHNALYHVPNSVCQAK